MDTNKKVRDTFTEYIATIDLSLQEVFSRQEDLLMYKHMEYFMGFRNEDLEPATSYGGKRFRAGLCLMLADWYGIKNEGIPLATSIELFHNFTLIHDDIVDGDTLRRGRPTMWKLFGVDHAINSGDAQLILALQTITDSPVLSAEQKVQAHSFLLQQYLKVAQGQYMDFELTQSVLGAPNVTKEAYLRMVGHKTADLIAATTQVAGIVSGKNETECALLFSYGYNLGVAYQLSDDVVSIWGTQEQTGKRLYGDLLEKKKTLPILHLFENGSDAVQKELCNLYNTEKKIHLQDAEKIIQMLDVSDVHTYMYEMITEKTEAAKNAVAGLSIAEDQKEILHNSINQLLPDIKKL